MPRHGETPFARHQEKALFDDEAREFKRDRFLLTPVPPRMLRFICLTFVIFCAGAGGAPRDLSRTASPSGKE